MSQRRRSPVDTTSPIDNAFTWFFAGLLVIALVAGLLGQISAV